MAKISIVPKLAAGSVTLDEIPASFKEDFEAAYKDFLADPDRLEMRVEFESTDEKKTWNTYLKSYTEQRMDANGNSARLKVRGLPKRNIPDLVSYYSITIDVEANGNVNTNQ